MRVEVTAEGTERLQNHYTTGANVLAVKQRLEGLEHGSIRRLQQQTEQLALALDEPAQDAWDRECPVAVRHGRENLARQLLRKKHGALGLAA